MRTLQFGAPAPEIMSVLCAVAPDCNDPSALASTAASLRTAAAVLVTDLARHVEPDAIRLRLEVSTRTRDGGSYNFVAGYLEDLSSASQHELHCGSVAQTAERAALWLYVRGHGISRRLRRTARELEAATSLATAVVRLRRTESMLVLMRPHAEHVVRRGVDLDLYTAMCCSPLGWVRQATYEQVQVRQVRTLPVRPRAGSRPPRGPR